MAPTSPVVGPANGSFAALLCESYVAVTACPLGRHTVPQLPNIPSTGTVHAFPSRAVHVVLRPCAASVQALSLLVEAGLEGASGYDYACTFTS
jgi:hypothetical protein